MKKKVLLLAIILFAFIVLPLISAQFPFGSGELKTAGEQIITWIQDIFGPFFEVLLGVNQVDKYFFAKILFLILMYVIILSVLKKIELFKKYPFVYILISAIVSILATRYLTENEFIAGVLIPYGALGISLVVFLPFLIYFFFVHNAVEGPAGRKLAWVLFAAVFLGLWITRWTEIKGFNWIYGIAIGAITIAFLFDERIHEYFGYFEAKREEKKRIRRNIADLESRLSHYYNILTPSDEVKTTIEELEDRIRELRRKL